MKKKCDCNTAHRIIDKKRKQQRALSKRAHLKQLNLAIARHKKHSEWLEQQLSLAMQNLEYAKSKLYKKKWWFLWLK